MNILPLVLALLLILSVLTVEKYEKFKNTIFVQKQYELAIENQDRKYYNKAQEAMLKGNKEKNVSYRQLSFRPFIDKKLREPQYLEKYNQIRQITIDLIKVLYGHAAFYQEMQDKRPGFVEELLDAIQRATEKEEVNNIKRIDDIVRINLDDEELQEAFYHMLKGTIDKNEYKKMLKEENTSDQTIPPLNKKKLYFPLLTFLNYDGEKGDYSKCRIELRLASREVLLAIYGNPELVEDLISRRIELSKLAKKSGTVGPTAQFKEEFENKQKPGIKEDLLDYSITATSKKDRD